MRRLRNLAAVVLAVAASATAPGPAIADPYQLGDPRPTVDTSAMSGVTGALSGPDGTALVLDQQGVAHRDHTGRWRVHSIRTRDTVSIRAVPIEGGAFLVLWDEGTRLRALVITADGARRVLADVLDGISTDAGTELPAVAWDASGDGKGTVVVAAPTTRANGGVVAAVRRPGNAFGSQQQLAAPKPGFFLEPDVAVSAVAPDGSVSVGWEVQDGDGVSASPITWAAATLPPGTDVFGRVSGQPRSLFGLPPGRAGVPAAGGLSSADLAQLRDDTPTVRVYVRASRLIEVGRGVIRLCGTYLVTCHRAHVVEMGGSSYLVMDASTGLAQDQAPERLIPQTRLNGLWIARRGPDGVYDSPKRLTFTSGWGPVADRTGRRLELARIHGGRLTLTPAAPGQDASAATPRAEIRAETRGRRLTARVRCTRRCLIRATARYAGGRRARAVAHPHTVPTPMRRTLDPGEAGAVLVTLPARPRARRIVLTLTARDVRGRSRTRTFVYRRGDLVAGGSIRRWTRR